MHSDQKWRWAGIVSVVSICGVILTETAANLIGNYISDQIKGWETPKQTTAATMAGSSQAVKSEAEAEAQPEILVAAVPMRAAKEPQASGSTSLKAPPLPDTEPAALSGTVEKVLDTATLQVGGQRLLLAGITGFGSPYRDQLAKFIEEQGGKVRCAPIADRYSCFVSSVDLGLAALTNGAARTAADATPEYIQAEAEAKRNKRGIYQ
jgi:endonuclease YncB( thermonuclease family)